jgi:hypothetical protein
MSLEELDVIQTAMTQRACNPSERCRFNAQLPSAKLVQVGVTNCLSPFDVICLNLVNMTSGGRNVQHLHSVPALAVHKRVTQAFISLAIALSLIITFSPPVLRVEGIKSLHTISGSTLTF